MLYGKQLLAHRHWIILQFFGKELHLCARCSGVVLGYLSIRVLTSILSLKYLSIQFPIAMLVSFLFALPSIVDWLTQTVGLRQSNNNLRLKVGLLEGTGIGLLGLAEASNVMKLLVVIAFALGVLAVGFYSRRSRQRYS